MPNIKIFKGSFSGGEMSPDMFGRIDDGKYQSGVAKCRNFIARPQGPAENRAGFAFVNEVKNSNVATRLIPFTYSTTQTMVIEMGAGYFRFHTQGATLLAGSPAAYSGATAYIVGGLVSSAGINYYCILGTTGNAPPNATYWYPLPSIYYEIPNPYAAADLFDIHYVQSADVITLVHPTYPPRELRRNGATNWTLPTINFTPPISAPTNPTVTSTGFTAPGKYNAYYTVTAVGADDISQSAASTNALGLSFNITGITVANPGVITTAAHGLAVNDRVYISGITTGPTALNGNFYLVNTVPLATTLTLKTEAGVVVSTIGMPAWVAGGTVKLAFIRSNLFETGCTNFISWDAVSGATRYRVYKLQGGIYGYIGETGGLSIVDDNIAPDLGVTPPTYESAFNSAGNYPAAVSYYEQRRCFAGTTLEPQKIWMTRSGTESDMSYSLPIKDDDRIAFRVAAREANTIRHIIPLTQLLLLTSAAEWRVTSVNSDAITPSTISVRPQSYVGSSNVQPVVINNTLVYASSRGGHVRECGYNWQAQGFITGDLSIRAAHLFDTYTVNDMCYSKSPLPLIWMVSSTGDLLGLTYIPEQSIGAWHRHDTDGTFESCTVVAEGTNDVLYVIVKRTINSVTKRYIEQQQPRIFPEQKNAYFVDCGGIYDGANTSATTVTVSGGTLWGPSEPLTITSSTAQFNFPSQADVGDEIVIYSADGVTEYHLLITSTTSTTVAIARIDKILEVALRNVATTDWSFARNIITGLSHIEGKVVNILVDGAVHPQRTVSSGSVTLDRAGSYIVIGLPITADLQTLPAASQMDSAFGQGRYKNINKAWIRVYKSSGLFIGPDENNLVEAKQRTTEPYGSPPALRSQEILVMTTPTWADGGQVYIRQTDPLPLSIVGLTLEVAVGS